MRFKNIVLIDDDEHDQELFTDAINQLSKTVKCTLFNDGYSALEKLSQREFQPDVIFLDLNMPRMNGHEFLSEMKKDNDLKEIPVIIFSTLSHTATLEHSKSLGAFDYITKPGSFEELVTILKRYT